MDVTPQELRDIEIREAWRGYHRDDVDELLERAAGTIEHLESQIRLLQDRLAAAPARSAPQPEPVAAAPRPAPRPEPRPEPAPAPAPARAPIPDSDIIQRTLLLAQKAADEAVAEAQARAQSLMSESEAKAQALVSEAESTARRIAETERLRIEAEIQQLISTRDALLTDVDALERFETEYRDRIKRAVESELDRLMAGAGIAAPPRPIIRSASATASTSVAPAPVAPAPVEPASAPVEAAPVAREAVSAPAPARVVEPAIESVRPEPSPARFDEPEPTESFDEAPPTWEPEAAPAWAPEPAGGWSEAREPEVATSRARDDAGSAEAPLDALDDDAFFASLREAVRDEAPLGPRTDRFYDDDEDDDDVEGGRKLFRRRR